jgi:hypothetical protein
MAAIFRGDTARAVPPGACGKQIGDDPIDHMRLPGRTPPPPRAHFPRGHPPCTPIIARRCPSLPLAGSTCGAHECTHLTIYPRLIPMRYWGLPQYVTDIAPAAPAQASAMVDFKRGIPSGFALDMVKTRVRKQFIAGGPSAFRRLSRDAVTAECHIPRRDLTVKIFLTSAEAAPAPPPDLPLFRVQTTMFMGWSGSIATVTLALSAPDRRLADWEWVRDCLLSGVQTGFCASFQV